MFLMVLITAASCAPTPPLESGHEDAVSAGEASYQFSHGGQNPRQLLGKQLLGRSSYDESPQPSPVTDKAMVSSWAALVLLIVFLILALRSGTGNKSKLFFIRCGTFL